jgi:hypothetical protein
VSRSTSDHVEARLQTRLVNSQRICLAGQPLARSSRCPRHTEAPRAPRIHLTPTSGPRRTTITDHKPRRRGNAEPHVLTRGHQRVARPRAGPPAQCRATRQSRISVPLCLGVWESPKITASRKTLRYKLRTARLRGNPFSPPPPISPTGLMTRSGVRASLTMPTC